MIAKLCYNERVRMEMRMQARQSKLETNFRMKAVMWHEIITLLSAMCQLTNGNSAEARRIIKTLESGTLSIEAEKLIEGLKPFLGSSKARRVPTHREWLNHALRLCGNWLKKPKCFEFDASIIEMIEAQQILAVNAYNS